MLYIFLTVFAAATLFLLLELDIPSNFIYFVVVYILLLFISFGWIHFVTFLKVLLIVYCVRRESQSLEVISNSILIYLYILFFCIYIARFHQGILNALSVALMIFSLELSSKYTTVLIFAAIIEMFHSSSTDNKSQ